MAITFMHGKHTYIEKNNWFINTNKCNITSSSKIFRIPVFVQCNFFYTELLNRRKAYVLTTSSRSINYAIFFLAYNMLANNNLPIIIILLCQGSCIFLCIFKLNSKLVFIIMYFVLSYFISLCGFPTT